MQKSLKTGIQKIGQTYGKIINKREYQRQVFTGLNERPVEFRFVFDAITSLCPRTVLDVGTGTTALPSMVRTCGCLVTAIDNVTDYWPAGMFNKHFHVLDQDITKPTLDSEFDMITCVSVLEHIRDHRSAMRAMSRLLRRGGHLVLTCPYNEREYHSNVYAIPGSDAEGQELSFTTQAYSRAELDSWCHEGNLEIVKQEFWQFYQSQWWTVGLPVSPPNKVTRDELHQITCLLLRKG